VNVWRLAFGVRQFGVREALIVLEEGTLYKEMSTGYALLAFMNNNLGGRLRRQGLWLAACLALVATNHDDYSASKGQKTTLSQGH